MTSSLKGEYHDTVVRVGRNALCRVKTRPGSVSSVVRSKQYHTARTLERDRGQVLGSESGVTKYQPGAHRHGCRPPAAGKYETLSRSAAEDTMESDSDTSRQHSRRGDRSHTEVLTTTRRNAVQSFCLTSVISFHDGVLGVTPVMRYFSSSVTQQAPNAL